MSKSKFLIALTGSIACYKTCYLISQLRQQDHDVQVVATPSALKFIGEATLEGLSARKVISDCFTPNHMMDHIELARWADYFLIAPLTANHLSKIALGLADDFISTLVLAYEASKPLFLAPAMNSKMYENPIIQEHLRTLSSRGFTLLDPSAGTLACGEIGLGKMMEPDEILKIIFNSESTLNLTIKNKITVTPETTDAAPTKQKVLIVYGGTQEIIDGVRTITNISTGRTGADLTDALIQDGYAVTVLRAKTSAAPKSKAQTDFFVSHADLDNQVKKILSSNKFDAVIQLAAVSDFSVDKISGDDATYSPSKDIKINSNQSLTLTLKKNKKIIYDLKNYSLNPDIKVFAFKLTNTLDTSERRKAINALLSRREIDYVVHNDLSEMNTERTQHLFTFNLKNGESLVAPNLISLKKIITEYLPIHSLQNLNLVDSQIKSSTTIRKFGVQNDIMS